jgi:hypothetical protein
VLLGLCSSTELLYVLGASQSGLFGRDNSWGCYLVYAGVDIDRSI